MHGRCPKHTDSIQFSHSDRCEIWTDSVLGRCGLTLVPVSLEELQEIRVRHLKGALEKTTLPSWVVAGIQQIAYDMGHSAGREEVDNYTLNMLTTFETLQSGVQ